MSMHFVCKTCAFAFPGNLTALAGSLSKVLTMWKDDTRFCRLLDFLKQVCATHGLLCCNLCCLCTDNYKPKSERPPFSHKPDPNCFERSPWGIITSVSRSRSHWLMRMGGPIQGECRTTHADCGSKESSRLVSTGLFGLPRIDEARQLQV